MVPYFKAGLENNELCVWITSAPLEESEAREAMRGAVPHFDSYVERDQIEIIPHTDWYLQDGSFGLQGVMGTLTKRISAMADKGHSGLRASGNIGWLQKRDWGDFTRYEEVVGSLIGEHQMIAICSYPLQMCGVREALDVTKNHRHALIKQQGVWQLIGNSEQRRTEAALRKTEEEYRNLFENTQDGTEVIDGSTGRIVLANQAAARMFGFDSPEDMVGVDPLDYIPLEDREHVASMMSEYMFEKDLHKVIELRALRKDGTEIWLSAIGVKTEYQGRLAGLVSLRDITEHKQAEQALRGSEKHYRLLADNVSDVIWVTDMNLTPTYVSPSVTRLLGYSVEEALGRTLVDLLMPASLAMAKGAFPRALEGLRQDPSFEPPPSEVELVRKDGSTVWVESTLSFVCDSSGQLVEAVGVLRDITERKKAEQTIRESERRYRLLAENISDVIWVTDMNLRPTYFSPSVTRLLGFSVEEAMAGTVETRLAPESFKAAADALATVLTLGEREPGRASGKGTLELEFKCKDGSTVWADTTVSFLRDSAGRPVEILGVLRDISERRRVEERLRDSLRRLEMTMEGTIQAMASIVETKDGYTAGHQRRVSQLAYAVAREMGLSSDRCYAVRTAGLLHDIGKISLPTEILSKPGRLTEAEIALIQTHPPAAYEILKNIESFGEIGEMVLQHHERMNGSGYPLGLHGEEMVLEARILAVSDVVEAMSSHRPYRPALGLDKAREEISQNSGNLYDPGVVQACLRVLDQTGFEFGE